MIGSTLAHATIVGLVPGSAALLGGGIADAARYACVRGSSAPPPPPPPPAAQRRAEPVKPKAVPKAESAIAAPVEAPAEILPERPVAVEPEFGEGGVEGGVVGGIAGGIAGGIPMMPAPPPPPPPPPTPVKPVRIGGDIQQPPCSIALVRSIHRLRLARKKKGS